jgi:hypothetical protein
MKRIALAFGVALLAAVGASPGHAADGFTGNQWLELPEAYQAWYLAGAGDA